MWIFQPLLKWGKSQTKYSAIFWGSEVGIESTLTEIPLNQTMHVYLISLGYFTTSVGHT